jgi:hypothetical protein
LRLGRNPLRNPAALRRQSQCRALPWVARQNFCLWEESVLAEARRLEIGRYI